MIDRLMKIIAIKCSSLRQSRRVWGIFSRFLARDSIYAVFTARC